MRALACLVALLGLASAAYGSPGSLASAGSGTPLDSPIDLALRPSMLERTRPVAGVDIRIPPPAPSPRGQFCGPIFIEGVYAQHLAHLPASMLRGMAKPIGPNVLVVETPHVGATGAGGGLYGRF